MRLTWTLCVTWTERGITKQTAVSTTSYKSVIMNSALSFKILGTTVIVLQSILTFMNGIFFIVSSLALGYISRTMEASVQLQVCTPRIRLFLTLYNRLLFCDVLLQIPPLVIYCSSVPIQDVVRTEEQKASLLKSGETHQNQATTSEANAEPRSQDAQDARRGDVPST